MGNSDQWYYQHAGQTYGPVTTEALRWLIRSGQFQADLPIRQDSAQAWQPARAVSELGLPPAIAAVAAPTLVVPMARPAPPPVEISYASPDTGRLPAPRGSADL